MQENRDSSLGERIKEINDVHHNAACLFTREQVSDAIKTLAIQIANDYHDLNPVVMCIMNGGLVFCGELLLHLSFPLELDYSHTSRYRAGTDPDALQWISVPSLSLANRHVLLVDDILDEGHTLIALLKACHEQGAESVKSAVLINKKHQRKADASLAADYVALEVDDHYVFGYGMDYKGYLRNAPGIYAVQPALNKA